MTALDRAARQAVVTAYRGKRIACSQAHYPAIRHRLVQAVQFLTTDGDEEAAERVMVEVLRLDGVHGIPGSAS